MFLASLIPSGATTGATIHLQIAMDCIFGSANSTQYGSFTKFLSFPYRDGMILTLIMTFIAGVIFVTTFEFNSNNIFHRMVMFASALRIDHRPVNGYHFSFPLRYSRTAT